MQLVRLYNMNYIQDRRQKVIPVGIDRRTEPDRRTSPRLELDAQIKRDVLKAKDALSQAKSDEFIKSSKNTDINVNPTKQVLKTNSVSNIISNTVNNTFNRINEDKTQRFVAEAATGAVGAGLALALPLFAGFSNPFVLTALTVIGLVSGTILGSKAIDFYNAKK